MTRPGRARQRSSTPRLDPKLFIGLWENTDAAARGLREARFVERDGSVRLEVGLADGTCLRGRCPAVRRADGRPGRDPVPRSDRAARPAAADARLGQTGGAGDRRLPVSGALRGPDSTATSSIGRIATRRVGQRSATHRNASGERGGVCASADPPYVYKYDMSMSNMTPRLRFHWSLSAAGDPLRASQARAEQSGVPRHRGACRFLRASRAPAGSSRC